MDRFLRSTAQLILALLVVTLAMGAATILTARQGGTGIDTSASTGVPRIAAGVWTANAGVSHLAASTSADLAGVLSNETGSGLAVFATSPALTTPTIAVGSDATGDLYYRSAGGVFTRLPIGTAGQTLAVSAGLPAWSTGNGTFVPLETPAGTVNGTNTDFTLANAPTGSTQHVYLNGQVLDLGAGNDYTISGVTITFNVAPPTGDKIRVSYFR